MGLVQIRNLPPTFSRPIKVTCAILDLVLENTFLDLEGVTRKVLFRSCRRVNRNDFRFNDGIVDPVEHWIHADGEDVLVDMRVDTWCNDSSVRIWFVKTSNVNL